MSFIGPRALNVSEQKSLEGLMPGFERRLQVRLGLTGLAQICDKGDDPHEKYRYDMDYLQKLSPFFDIQLIILSVWNTLVVGCDDRSGKAKMTDSLVDKTKASESDKN